MLVVHREELSDDTGLSEFQVELKCLLDCVVYRHSLRVFLLFDIAHNFFARDIIFVSEHKVPDVLFDPIDFSLRLEVEEIEVCPGELNITPLVIFLAKENLF